jgi:hypothetical protein
MQDGIVRLRLQGSCHGCPSSAATMQNTIEQAIYAAAPDIVSLEVEGLAAGQPRTVQGFVPLTGITKTNSKPLALMQD